MIPSGFEGWAECAWGGGVCVGDLQSENGLAYWEQSWLTEHLNTHKHKNTHQSASTHFFSILSIVSSALCPETTSCAKFNPCHCHRPNCWITCSVTASETHLGALNFFHSAEVTLALKWWTPCGLSVWGCTVKRGLMKKSSIQRVVSSAMSLHFPVQTLSCLSSHWCACGADGRAEQERREERGLGAFNVD